MVEFFLQGGLKVEVDTGFLFSLNDLRQISWNILFLPVDPLAD